MVAANLREGARALGLCARLGIDHPYPERQPFGVNDSFGMLLACQSLLWSLDPGKNADTVQYKMMRKLRSHYSNFYHTLPGGTGLTKWSGDFYYLYSEPNVQFLVQAIHDGMSPEDGGYLDTRPGDDDGGGLALLYDLGRRLGTLRG